MPCFPPSWEPVMTGRRQASVFLCLIQCQLLMVLAGFILGLQVHGRGSCDRICYCVRIESFFFLHISRSIFVETPFWIATSSFPTATLCGGCGGESWDDTVNPHREFPIMDDWFSPWADADDCEQAPQDHSEERRHPPVSWFYLHLQTWLSLSSEVLTAPWKITHSGSHCQPVFLLPLDWKCLSPACEAGRNVYPCNWDFFFSPLLMSTCFHLLLTSDLSCQEVSSVWRRIVKKPGF